MTPEPEQPDTAVKYLADGAWLIEHGVIAHANRTVFHPIGLALELGSDEFGVVTLKLWDDRDDPEGTVFGSPGYGPELLTARNNAFYQLWAEREPARRARYGWMVQPINVDATGISGT